MRANILTALAIKIAEMTFEFFLPRFFNCADIRRLSSYIYSFIVHFPYHIPFLRKTTVPTN